MDKASLADKMRALATERTDLPDNWLATADAFETAAIGFYSEPQTCDAKRFLGCWARARKMWSDAIGDSLI